MTPGKRAFDLVVTLLALLLLWPLILAIALAVRICDGVPVLYRAERMKTPETGFLLWKFRTMTDDPARIGVTGGDKGTAITPLGRILRRTRLDELPQIWNVLRGDISLVGPRPPLRLYVELAPELYREVLQCRPGLTGLATLVFHRHEGAILARCRDAAETHEVYLRRCVPRKARLDGLYCRHRSVCFDLLVLVRTVRAMLGGSDRRRDAGKFPGKAGLATKR